MQTHDLSNGYTITISEMTRKSQLTISTWFNEWLTGIGANASKLDTVSAISTQIILHSRLTLFQDGVKCADGMYEIEDGVFFPVPMTETALNELPASWVAWMIDAAGKENAVVLTGFLAAIRLTAARGTKTYERLSGSGRSSSLIQH